MELFINSMYLVLTFECVDEILWCYHLNKTSLVECLHSALYFLDVTTRNFSLFYKTSDRVNSNLRKGRELE